MSEKKLHIALLFGGNSSEHDVSKRSAHTVFDALDKDKYEVSVFMFTKQGFLLGNKDSMRIFDGEPEDAVVAEAIKDVDFSNPLANIQSLSEVKDIDLFIPVIHGNMGEDGTVQSLFRLLNKPYIGSGIASSAVSFDKDLTKQLLTYHGIRNTKYVVVTPENQSEYTYEKCAAELGETLFVKAHPSEFTKFQTRKNSIRRFKTDSIMISRFWLKKRLPILVKSNAPFWEIVTSRHQNLALSAFLQKMRFMTTTTSLLMRQASFSKFLSNCRKI